MAVMRTPPPGDSVYFRLLSSARSPIITAESQSGPRVVKDARYQIRPCSIHSPPCGTGEQAFSSRNLPPQSLTPARFYPNSDELSDSSRDCDGAPASREGTANILECT